MNVIIPPEQVDQELSAVRAAVRALDLPVFVDDFEIGTGEFDGDPALWIIFKTNVDDRMEGAELEDHLRSRLALRVAAETAIYKLGGTRVPFVKFRHT